MTPFSSNRRDLDSRWLWGTLFIFSGVVMGCGRQENVLALHRCPAEPCLHEPPRLGERLCAASVDTHTHARTHRGSTGAAQTVVLATLCLVWSFPQVEGTPRRGWRAGPGDTPLASPTGFTAQHGRPPLRPGHLRPPSPVGRAPDTGCSGSNPRAPDSGIGRVWKRHSSLQP